MVFEGSICTSPHPCATPDLIHKPSPPFPLLPTHVYLSSFSLPCFLPPASCAVRIRSTEGLVLGCECAWYGVVHAAGFATAAVSDAGPLHIACRQRVPRCTEAAAIAVSHAMRHATTRHTLRGDTLGDDASRITRSETRVLLQLGAMCYCCPFVMDAGCARLPWLGVSALPHADVALGTRKAALCEINLFHL